MNVSSLYDRYWQSGLHRVDEWPDDRLGQVLGPLLGLERVLDYGCGMGDAYQRGLATRVKTYEAADVSDAALARARERGFPAWKIDPETGQIPVSSGAYDGVVSVEVLEHLYDPLAAAREMFRILKPGGRLVVTVPNFGYHEYRLLALLRAQVPSEPEDPKVNRFNGVHIRFFSKLMLKRLLRTAGFEEVQIGSFDEASVWDIFRAGGHFAHISEFARRHFPRFLHLTFLQYVWPNVFAKRLRATARKPSIES